MDEGLIKLIIFGVIGLFIVLGKVLSKKKEAGGEGSEEGQPGRPPGQSSGPQNPEEALEQMFRQMQERRKRPEAETPPAARQPAEQVQPQTLDDFFGQRGEQPSARTVPPVARAIPVAKPVPQARPYREPTVRSGAAVRRPPPPRVMLRRPKAAFATAGRQTLAAEQHAKMAEAKAKREAASALATQDSTKAVQGRVATKAMLSLGGGIKLDRAEVAKAIVYQELLGAPRAVRPYAGPPAAG